jgi:hypothetical protein
MYHDLGNIEQFLDVNVNDTLFLKISIGVFTGGYFLMMIIQFIFIILRRNIQPLKSRGIHIIFLFFFGQQIPFFLFNIRLASGRIYFSCIVYTLAQFTVIHGK